MGDSKKKVRKAVVPAAGLGTRLLPATKSVPKELLPIIDAPAIHYIAEEAIASGIEELILVTNGSKQAILDYFTEQPKLEKMLAERGKEELIASARRVRESIRVVTVNQAEPKGLGHAILMAEALVGDEPFAILNPDELVDASLPCTKQLAQIYETHGPVVGLQAVPPERVSLYGIADIKETLSRGLHRMAGYIEKPSVEKAPSNLSAMGRYILPPEIFGILKNTPPAPNGEIQLSDAIHTLTSRMPVYGFEFEGTRYDTGDVFGLIEANIAFALKHPKTKEKMRGLLKKLSTSLS
jgi:UTP--glucose-1-phosphate uridylyltransferase